MIRPGSDEGFRLLVTRYRPRALPKAEETWDAWWKELGPSPALFNAVYGKGQPAIAWEEYARRYREEMRASTPRQKIAWLAQSVARGEPLTLFCSSCAPTRSAVTGRCCARYFLRRSASLSPSFGAE